MSTSGRFARLLVAFALVAISSHVQAQAPTTVSVLGNNGANGKETILRFDRRLELVGSVEVTGGALTHFTQVATDGQGIRWIGFDSLNSMKLVRLGSSGQLLPSANLAHNPVALTLAGSGRVYALTRIPLAVPGPLYAVDAAGSVLWSNPAAPTLPDWLIYPRQLVATVDGELWMGDGATLHGIEAQPYIVRVDPDDGSIVQTLELPSLVDPELGSAAVTQLVGAIDGTLWALVSGGGDMLVNTDGERTIQAFELVNAGENDTAYHLRVDAAGRLLVVNYYEFGGVLNGDTLLRFDPAARDAPDAAFPLGGYLDSFALGPTGEEAFAVVNKMDAPGPPFPLRLVRVNLVTGVKSSIPLTPTWFDCHLGYGDPTGFIWANVTDRMGDPDGDGAANAAETAAGSNPFDAVSRPDGPKVYLSFAQSNHALILKYTDPSGILDSAGGLHVPSLSLTIGPFGEVFHYLLPFLTFVQVSPDWKSVTAFFGALPLASGTQWKVEASVTDKTGAKGWDWQVVPPGDL